jgi:hypothetical protein
MPVKRIFTLRVSHSHTGASLPSITVSAATAALLSGLGMGIKCWDGSLLAYVEIDANGATATKLSGKVTFRFLIGEIDSSFAALTDLTFFKDLSAPIFSNSLGSLSLILEDQEGFGHEQVLALRNGPQRVILSGRPAPNAQPGKITAKSRAGAVTVHRYHNDANALDLEGPGLREGVPIQLDYPIPTRRPFGAMAEIAITLDQVQLDTWLSEGAADFVIPFTARQVRWCWYIAVPSAIPANAVAIKLLTKPEQLRGLALMGPATDLTEAPDEADPQAKILAPRLMGRRLLRFLSAEPVILDAAAIAGITLEINQKTRIRHLPNPSPEAFGQIGPPGQSIEILHSTVVI